MDAEARLAAAMAAAAAPPRDPAFALAVIRADEARRFKEQATRAVLRAAGLAAALAALIPMLADWAARHAEAVQTGVLGAVALLALVGAARIVTERGLARAWGR